MTDVKDYVLRLSAITEDRKVTAPMCKMHFEKQPMKISKGAKQYVYDEMGYEFLDCSGNLAHVGHCHPHVLFCGQKQMQTLSVAQGFVTEAQSTYAKNLLASMQDSSYDTVLFVNSGSEAVDLAMRLAQAYTKRNDVVVPQPGLYGHLSSLTHMHYKFLRNPDFVKADWVHHIPVCNTYRGVYSQSEHPAEDAIDHLKTLLADLATKGKPVAALITEAIHTAAGNVIPPQGYLPSLIKTVRDAGGLVIVDEVNSGLGRYGKHWWAYQHLTTISPDIVVCGRSLANGQPLACVVTSRQIANALPTYANSYGGNPVSCAMGNAVLDVINNEHLLESSANVGKALLKGFHEMQPRHANLGDIRGRGLSIVLEIVKDKESRKPASDIAEKLTYRLRDHYRILVPADGPDMNCMYITPPMCFSLENAETLIKDIDLALTDVEENRIESVKTLFELQELFKLPDDIFGDEKSLKRRADSPLTIAGSKKSRYDELD